jgi:hypothetical protein
MKESLEKIDQTIDNSNTVLKLVSELQAEG